MPGLFQPLSSEWCRHDGQYIVDTLPPGHSESKFRLEIVYVILQRPNPVLITVESKIRPTRSHAPTSRARSFARCESSCGSGKMPYVESGDGNCRAAVLGQGYDVFVVVVVMKFMMKEQAGMRDDGTSDWASRAEVGRDGAIHMLLQVWWGC
jgi:hypothetical protein